MNETGNEDNWPRWGCENGLIRVDFEVPLGPSEKSEAIENTPGIEM